MQPARSQSSCGHVRSMSPDTFSMVSGRASSGETIKESRWASISNLAERDHFINYEDDRSYTKNRDVLPQELETREGWSIITEPQWLDICSAIVQDNYSKIVKYSNQISELNKKLSGFPVDITTRSNVRIVCSNMFIGNLLCLCGSPRVFQFLQNEGILTYGMFNKKINMQLDCTALNIFCIGGAAVQNNIVEWKSVPGFSLVPLRDSFGGVEWLVKNGYIRKLIDVDADSRNVLHISIDLESSQLIYYLLATRHIVNLESLQQLFCQKDKYGQTPFIKACNLPAPVMLISILQSLPTPFLVGEMDSTGCSLSLINALITKLSDCCNSIEFIKFVLRRGATVDTAYYDKSRSLEVAMECVYYSGEELDYLVKLLIKNNAYMGLSTMLSLIGSTVRTEAEIIDIAHTLLHTAGDKVLIDPYTEEMKALDEETDTGLEDNIVIQMLQNAKICTTTVTELLDLLRQFVDIGKLFPSADNLAIAFVGGIRQELKISDTASGLKQQRGLPPEKVEGIFKTLTGYTMSINPDEIPKIRFHDKLYHSMMCYLFQETDFSLSQLPKDKLGKLLGQYIKAFTDAGFDPNASINGKISTFSIACHNIPGWLLLSLFKDIPSKFKINMRDRRGENLATTVIKSFSNKYKILLSCLKLLESKGFDLGAIVCKDQTLLMVFIEYSGTTLKELEITGQISEDQVENFLNLLSFLLRHKSMNVYHVKKTKDDQDEDINISCLSIALTIGLAPVIREIVQQFPQTLFDVSPSVMMNAITKHPEILEFFTSPTICRCSITVLPQKKKHNAHLNNGSVITLLDDNSPPADIEKEEYCEKPASHFWVKYCTMYHNDLLKINEMEEVDDIALQLIYDYFMECELQPKTDKDENNMTFTKPSIKSVLMDHTIFAKYPYSCNEDFKDINTELLSTVADNMDMRVHPFLSEYKEKYYVNAFFVAVIMNFIHLALVVLYTGHMVWVFLNVGREVGYYSGFNLYKNKMGTHLSGYYNCKYNTCNVTSSTLLQDIRNCETSSTFPDCNICEARVLQLNLCVAGTAVYSKCPFPLHTHNFWIMPTQIILLVFSIVAFIKLSIQVYTLWKLFKQNIFWNSFELIMYVGIIITTLSFTECGYLSGYRNDWQYNIGIVTLYISWSMMFFYMSRFQAFGTYVIMFYTTVRTGCWLLVAFMPIILAYSFTFFLLLSNRYSFRDPWNAFIKTINMMIGDTDYSNIFEAKFSPSDSSFSELDHLQVYHEHTVKIIHMSFIVTIVIVLMNLFIGLMVGDVEKINQEAEVTTWQNSLDFIVAAYNVISLKDTIMKIIKKTKKKENEDKDATCLEDIRVIYNLSMSSLKKVNVIANMLGLVNKTKLTERILMGEKRKRKIKTLVRGLTEKYPYLYVVYSNTFDPEEGNNLFTVNKKLHECHDHDHGNDHKHGNHESPFDDKLRRLALPEDIDNDDPQIKIKRNKSIVYPNKLNRLYRPTYMATEPSEHTEYPLSIDTMDRATRRTIESRI